MPGGTVTVRVNDWLMPGLIITWEPDSDVITSDDEAATETVPANPFRLEIVMVELSLFPG